MLFSNCLRCSARTAPQWWKNPVYYRPVVSPLERGPDFSFADGRRPAFTTQSELERRLKHVELGKKIVQCLAQIRRAEELYAEHRAHRLGGQKRVEQSVPKAKGTEDIF